MRLILTRHYCTQSNKDGIILGWSDSPACPGWRDDIEFIYQQLSANNVCIDAVYSSDLERARQTANTYAGLFGIEEVNCAAEIKEINYGRLQTRRKARVKETHPEYKEDPAFVFPGGESFQQMQQRSIGFLLALAQRQAERTVLMVSHAGVIRAIISHCVGLNYASSLKYRIPFRYVGDFQLAGGNCLSYNELGEESGFIAEGAVLRSAVLQVTG